MTTRSMSIVGCFCLIVGGAGELYSQAAQLQRNTPAATEPRAVLNTYCVTCHNGKLKTADLLLDTLDLARAGDHAQEWEKVAGKFRTAEMPPPGLPRPDRAIYTGMAARIE